MIRKNSVVLGYLLSKDRTELMSWFTSVIKLSSSGLLIKQRPNRADVLVYQRNKTPVTRIVGFTPFVEVLFEQDVQNIFKERKINCSLTYLIHFTQK